MHHSKKTAFSSDCKYFASVDNDNNLLIWETQNKDFIDCKFDSINNTCSSLHWISENRRNSPKKAKISKNHRVENNLLAVGTVKGDILIYNVSSKNLYLHLVGRHSDAVNDMCFYEDSNLFFTCSNDEHIGIWDINTGRQISKWKADDNPISSICVLDNKNMLSSSRVVIWWNLSDKTIIKTFTGHSTEIFRLLPVNIVSLPSCYFLTAANQDVKINAWSLASKECDSPVASFVLPVEPKAIDVSKVSSKNKPLILSAVTKDGFLHLFEHTLNGNVNQPIHPNVSTSISSDLVDASFISTKVYPDSEFCIVAYGSSKLNMTFKHIKIKEFLKKSDRENIASINNQSPKVPVVNDTCKAGKKHSVNGIKAAIPENSSKIFNSLDSLVNNYRRKLRSPNIPPLTVPKATKNCEKDVNLKDPKSCVDSLLEALQERNDIIIEAVIHNSDTEFISACINYLPSSSLKYLLDELCHRLQQKYSPALCKWLRETQRVHLRYLAQRQDIDSLHQIKKYMDSKHISSTIQKMAMLKGLLSHQIQDSSDESSSENEERMES